jgi:putative DNA primase/helicase
VTPRDYALDYATLGLRVTPWGTRGNQKFPLTEHGHLDATTDRAIIERWWARWPNAVPAIATGEPSGVVALDIDIRPDGSGFDSLDYLGITSHPEGPTAHTPQGGCAVLFRWPGCFVKTCSSELGPHLDIRGDGGSLILPQGPGRSWDPILGPDLPLAPMPVCGWRSQKG